MHEWSEIILKFQTVPPLRVDLESVSLRDGSGVSCTITPHPHTIDTKIFVYYKNFTNFANKILRKMANNERKPGESIKQ